MQESNSKDGARGYKSVIQNRWDNVSTVRNHPRPSFNGHKTDHGDGVANDFFSRKLAPATQHSLVSVLPSKAIHELLVQYYFAFQQATTALETHIINPNLIYMIEQYGLQAFPEQFLLDARKVYVDEAWHSEVAENGVYELECLTGSHPVRRHASEFLTDFHDIVDREGRDHVEWIRFLKAFVTETSVSQAFQLLPVDQTVHPVVREAVGQHSLDEATHHLLYREALRFIWPVTTEREKQIAGRVIPEFLRNVVFGPDSSREVEILRAIGLSQREAERAMKEGSNPESILQDMRATSRTTVRYCHESGVLSDPDNQANFSRAGLI